MSKHPITDALPMTTPVAAILEHARRLESDRAALVEALRYWLPDETMVGPESDSMWDRHIKLLQRIDGGSHD